MLKQYLLNNWERLIGERKPKSLQIATISSCREVFGNDLVLIFIDSSKKPQYFLKIVRGPMYNFKLARENYALVTLHKSKSLKQFVPKSYADGEVNGRYYFIQGAVAGKNLSNVLYATGLNRRNIVLIEKSALLLSKINMAHEQIANIHNENVFGEDELKLLQKEYFSVEGEWDAFGLVFEANQYFRKQGRRYFLHGDYWPANILVDEKKCEVKGIIDWEFASPCSNSPNDIIWFLITLSYNLFCEKKSSITLENSFKWGFFKEGEHNQIFTNTYQMYLAKLNITEKNMFKPLLLLSLCEMAMREKIAYGYHGIMDKQCLDLLKYALAHDSYMDSL